MPTPSRARSPRSSASSRSRRCWTRPAIARCCSWSTTASTSWRRRPARSGASSRSASSRPCWPPAGRRWSCPASPWWRWRRSRCRRSARPIRWRGRRWSCSSSAPARPACASSSADLDAVVDLCRRLDGLPLALEIAAARARTMSPAEIAERLRRGTDVLDRPRFRGATRHRSVAETIRWSYDLLGQDERELLEHLAVFAGPFDGERRPPAGGLRRRRPALRRPGRRARPRLAGGRRHVRPVDAVPRARERAAVRARPARGARWARRRLRPLRRSGAAARSRDAARLDDRVAPGARARDGACVRRPRRGAALVQPSRHRPAACVAAVRVACGRSCTRAAPTTW